MVGHPATKVGELNERPCFTSYREAEPSENEQDINSWMCPFYDDIRQLFTGIQSAGARLGPTSLDKGFHAIPAVASADPTLPACFYETDDYTCIKDAVAEWWDPQGDHPASEAPGCWRMPDDAKRYLSGRWPNEDVASRKNPSDDPCNGYSP